MDLCTKRNLWVENHLEEISTHYNSAIDLCTKQNRWVENHREEISTHKKSAIDKI